MDEGRSYPLPTKTLPSLEMSHHISDIIEIRDFFEKLGIATSNTRIERYGQYLEQARNADLASIDGLKIFKNAASNPFQSPTDWLLYVLREVHELMWILKGLKARLPSGVEEKLKIIAGGSDFAALDADFHSRNVQFELRIASYFCQAGCDVDLCAGVDVVALTDTHAFYLECKRVASKGQMAKRLSKARAQLTHRLPRNNGKRQALGCVAVDVTKIAYPHNGLTWGLTNEHVRDVVQDKLLQVEASVTKLLSFDHCPGLLNYWLQIHIASLIFRPEAMPASRFSSYHISKPRLRRQDGKSLAAFYALFQSVSKQDERALPPRSFTHRKSVNFSAGSTIGVKHDRIRELLARTEPTEAEQLEVVATLNLDDTEHEFTFFEINMLPPEVMREWFSMISKDRGQAWVFLVAKLYLQRYPYEEGGPDTELSKTEKNA